MSRVPKDWSVNEENLSVAEFGVLLLFAAAMLWLAPWLRKRGFPGWATAVKAVAAVGMIVCFVHAFV